MKNFRRIITYIVLVVGFLSANAEQNNDGVTGKRHFRLKYVINSTKLDSSFLDNSTRIVDIQEFLEAMKSDPLVEITGVDFRGTASPDGSYEFNVKLSEDRLKSFKKLVNSYIFVPDSLILAQSGAIPWDEFRIKVAESNIPMRDEVLEIIDQESKLVPYPGNRHIDARLLELKKLDNGRVWNSLKPILADLRYGDAVFYYTRHWPAVNPLTFTLMEAEVLTPDWLDAPEVVHVWPMDTLTWTPGIHLKTNLIGWAAASANLGVEFDLAPHWSINLHAYYSAVDYFKRTIKFRNLTFQPELRYWPSVMDKGVNGGFFVGAHFGMMYYNFAIGGPFRYQDRDGKHPALGGGVSVGYRKPISKNKRWNVEFSAGAGCYALDYDVFRNPEDYKEGEWVRSKKKTWFGLDNATISISYDFGLKKYQRTYLKEGGEL